MKTSNHSDSEISKPINIFFNYIVRTYYNLNLRIHFILKIYKEFEERIKRRIKKNLPILYFIMFAGIIEK